MNNPLFTVNGASARVILDSISPDGIRLPTIHARYPRMVHADAKTHRMIRGWHDEMLVAHHDISLLADENISRNGRSSRAVPVKRLLEEAKSPYMPHFLKNQPGMMASEEFTPEELEEVNRTWLDLAEYTRRGVERLTQLGVHKQWANRPLEWSGYIDVLISATNLENFFALRDHEAAQPEVQDLAKAMRMALDASTPQLLQPGEWHLPYVTDEDAAAVEDYLEPYPVETHPTIDVLKKLSVARCARLTYEPFNGDGSIEAEIKRYNLLVVSQPVHASPAEHQATPDVQWSETSGQHTKDTRHDAQGRTWVRGALHGNFTGWIQLRKTLPNEFVAG